MLVLSHGRGRAQVTVNSKRESIPVLLTQQSMKASGVVLHGGHRVLEIRKIIASEGCSGGCVHEDLQKKSRHPAAVSGAEVDDLAETTFETLETQSRSDDLSKEAPAGLRLSWNRVQEKQPQVSQDIESGRPGHEARR